MTLGIIYYLQVTKNSVTVSNYDPVYIGEGILNKEKLPVNKANQNYDMAFLYEEQSEYEKASEYYILAVEEARLDDELSPDDLTSMYTNYASLLVAMGEFEDAIDILDYVSDAASYSTDNENINAAVYHNLAYVYYKKGDYPTAVRLYSKALDIRERILGTEHPDTAITSSGIALSYTKLGNYETALEIYERVLLFQESTLGTEHPDTAATYNNIAYVYARQEAYEKAVDLYKKSLDIFENVLGTEHQSTVIVYSNIAVVYSVLGEYVTALELCTKALDTRENALGMEHPDTAITYNNIACIEYKLGNYTSALIYYNKASAIFEKKLGTEHLYTIRVNSGIAATHEAINGGSHAPLDDPYHTITPTSITPDTIID